HAQRHRLEALAEPKLLGIAREGQLSREGVLVHPDARDTVQGGRTERERAIVIADHHDLAGCARLQCSGGFIQDQPIRGIRREQVVGLYIRPASKRVERKGGHSVTVPVSAGHAGRVARHERTETRRTYPASATLPTRYCAPLCSSGRRSPLPCSLLRSVPSVYSVWYAPRACSTGITNSTMSSKVPGVMAYARLKPSTSVSSTHSCSWSAICSPLPMMNGPRPPMAPWMAMSRTVHCLPSSSPACTLATADWMALLLTLPIGSSRS